MEPEKATGSTDIKKLVVVPDDEANEAASDVGGLSERFRFINDHSCDTDQALALHESPATTLLKAHLDLLKYLANKAQTATDKLLVRHPDMERLRSDARHLRTLSELIAQVESNGYMCRLEDQKELQSWSHRLVSLYAGGSETDERIARVVAVEKSMGLGDAGDEIWGA